MIGEIIVQLEIGDLYAVDMVGNIIEKKIISLFKDQT